MAAREEPTPSPDFEAADVGVSALGISQEEVIRYHNKG